MSLRVETNYVAGIPQTSIQGGLQCYGQDWHWTAGGTGRAGAESVIRGFIATRYTVNASYHILLWVEHKASHLGCVTYAMWIVPPDRASHSVNPANCWKYNPEKPRAQQDARFAETRRILGPKANDPNAGSIAVSYCGMPANLAQDVQCPVFIADCKRLSSDLAAIPTMNPRPHFAHGWIQPISRYEMDSQPVGGVDLIISKMYGAAPTPSPVQEDDMYEWVAGMKPANFRATIIKGVPMRSGPGPNYPGFNLGDSGRTITFIGEVPDEGGGAIPYIVYVLGAGGLHCTRKDNIEPGTVIELGTPTTVEVVKEVIKEVPTGILPEDLEKAADAERSRIAAAEAERIRSI